MVLLAQIQIIQPEEEEDLGDTNDAALHGFILMTREPVDVHFAGHPAQSIAGTGTNVI